MVAWTADHLPLAGQYDWVSLVPVAIVAVVLLAVGVEAFARRDLGVTSTVRFPAMPAVLLGQNGPVGRSFGERLPVGARLGPRPRRSSGSSSPARARRSRIAARRRRT